MDPAFVFGHLDPANRFAMEGLNMAFAAELTREGKPLPKMLFMDIMVEKTQMLINHIKQMHLGLSLMANVSKNVATVRMHNNYVINSLLLHVTISNLWDIEDQLYRLWVEVNGVLHDFNPALE